ncbi:MAG: acetate/propionate family kinase [Herminiimonas sp.]|nr:acetate/propionate family kinase [Herminiimonas sp.]
MSAPNILALNSGSSSLKFGLFRVDAAGAEKLLSETFSTASTADHPDAMARVASALAASGMPAPDAIGHRIVHGGPALRQHCRINDAVLRQLQAAAAFAPLHTPAALALIRSTQTHFPGIAQVACFDTQFHVGLPDVARVLPIARELLSEGVQRYGFHGLSLESIVRQLGDVVPQRLVIAHLGNGASITALKAGQSIDTSMGLTPSGGVIMGTRSGDLDPGVLVYLLREKKLDAAGLDALIDQRSGLLGISGLSGDMRRLHEAAASNRDARLAIEMFCYSVRKQLAAMIAVLGGVDMLVFTGGIGENDAQVRAEICHGLSWTGISLDEVRNRDVSNALISAGASRCQVLVLASQEDEQIARHAWGLLK